MKRILGLIVSVALLLGILATSGALAENSSTETGEWPRTIVDATGAEIVLEKAPERITLLHVVYLEHFLLLESPPTAAAIGNQFGQTEALESSELFGPYMNGAEITLLGNSKDLSLEAILASEPEVIVTFHNGTTTDDSYEQMAEIAPVVQINYYDTWQNQLLLCAQMLGKEDLAQSVIADIEQNIATAKEKLAPYADRSLGLFRTDGKSFITQGYASYYENFGLTKPTGFTDKFESVSLEAVAEMNPYYIVFQHNYEAAKAFVDSMEASSVWQSLDAVKNGRVVYFDENMNSYGPLALNLAATKLVDLYTK